MLCQRLNVLPVSPSQHSRGVGFKTLCCLQLEKKEGGGGGERKRKERTGEDRKGRIREGEDRREGMIRENGGKGKSRGVLGEKIKRVCGVPEQHQALAAVRYSQPYPPTARSPRLPWSL